MTITSKEVWDVAAEFGVSYGIAKRMLEREIAAADSQEPKTKTTYQTEFPNFPAADMPAIPEGFADESWHNDTCPRFRNSALRLTLHIDYLNPADREHPKTARFGLVREDDVIVSDADREFLAETDDWNVILEKIAKIANPPAPKTIEIGARVRTTQAVENYPVIYLEIGATGTLDHVDDDGSYWVTLDAFHPELTEWENQVQIWDYSEQDAKHHPTESLEVIDDKDALGPCGEAYQAWLTKQGLPQRSADELLHETITEDQRAYLSGFYDHWNRLEAAKFSTISTD